MYTFQHAERKHTDGMRVIKLADMFGHRNFSIPKNSDNEHIRKKEKKVK